MGFKVNAACKQREAVNAIIRGGAGEICFDYELVTLPGNPGRYKTDPNALLPGPVWLQNIFGVDFFRNAVGIVIPPGGHMSVQIAQLDQLPTLEYVSFFGGIPPLTDLPVLERLPRLQSLAFCPTNDAVLKNVTELKQLKHLHVAYGQDVTDDGMEAIGTLTGLESLTIPFTQITDEGLAHLQKLPNLQYLDLVLNDKNTDDGLKQLENIQALKRLAVDGAKITDAGIRHLQNLQNIEELDLSDTAITDAGLQYFVHLKKLKTLDLSGTKVTLTVVQELQKSLPTTKISGP